MLKSYDQQLRESIVDADRSPEEKVLGLNLLEAIIEGEMSIAEIVDAIQYDNLPVRYQVIKPNRA